MKKALIIDDNQMNLDTLALLLKRENIIPILLQTPKDIQKTVENMGVVDVVFLDLEFPGYDGMQLVSQIQMLPALQGVPIVAYSVHTSELNEAKQAGFHSFIGKPVAVERFPDQLQRIFNGERVWEV